MTKLILAILSVLLLLDIAFAIPANRTAKNAVYASPSPIPALFTDKYGNQFTTNGFVTYITHRGCPAIARYIRQDQELFRIKKLLPDTNEGDRYREAKRQYNLFCGEIKLVPINFNSGGMK